VKVHFLQKMPLRLPFWSRAMLHLRITLMYANGAHLSRQLPAQWANVA
jgi:hypothetical protein